MNTSEMINDFVAQSVGSKDQGEALMGRLLATGVLETIHKWHDAELDRGTKSDRVIWSLVGLIGFISGMPISHSKQNHELDVARLLVEAISKQILETAEEFMQIRASAHA